MLPIYHDEPTNWKELQVRVARIFNDIGYHTEIEKDVALSRGKVNVDVYATKKLSKTLEIKIAECKYWNNPIPKSVIHATRTVILDSGANTGYIISKMGFQKGAIDAANGTNLVLLSFDEFQTEYRLEWINGVIDKLEKVGEPLDYFCNLDQDYIKIKLHEANRNNLIEFQKLQDKYWGIASKSRLITYKNFIDGKLNEYFDQIVLDSTDEYPKDSPKDSLMNYFEYMGCKCRKGILEFKKLIE